MLTHWNGSFLHPDTVVAEVKRIDRRYSGEAVRRELRSLVSRGVAEKVEEGRSVKYGINDPDKPRRPYWAGSRAPREEPVHEDIIPMEPWPPEEGC